MFFQFDNWKTLFINVFSESFSKAFILFIYNLRLIEKLINYWVLSIDKSANHTSLILIHRHFSTSYRFVRSWATRLSLYFLWIRIVFFRHINLTYIFLILFFEKSVLILFHFDCLHVYWQIYVRILNFVQLWLLLLFFRTYLLQRLHWVFCWTNWFYSVSSFH